MPSSIKWHRILAIALAGLYPSVLPAQTGDAGPESVVVVANSAFPGSVEVARTYLALRKIPESNLIILDSVQQHKIARELFTSTIWNPLLDALLEGKLVEGFKNEPDAYGRRSILFLQSKVRYLVLCYGIPYYILAGEVAEETDRPFRTRHVSGQAASLASQMVEGNLARNDASVDGELALLLRRETPLKGFYPNPLFNNRVPDSVRDILRVTRLDGPSVAAVQEMIRQGLKGELAGLKGRAYVDEDTRQGNYQSGNQWLADSARVFDKLGYDLSHERTSEVFPADARFDAPVLYAGWYANKVTGPFTLPGFRFPPGAVAVHLHSFSARSLRNRQQGWVGPFVDLGVSATLGNVAEPYLNLTHHFSLFFAALASGWNFADAAYMALPGLSWQGVAIGDPLFRPFKVGLEDQLKAIGDPARILEDQYVVMRQVNLLRSSGHSAEAEELANRGMVKTPGPALALQRARIFQQAGDREKASAILTPFAELSPVGWSDWGLLAETADTLRELDRPQAALRIYRNLEKQNMPEQVQLAFLRRGIQAAEEAGESEIASEWQARVTPPPPLEEAPPTASTGTTQ